MNAAEWHESGDPQKMLAHLVGAAARAAGRAPSDRKLRLFGIASWWRATRPGRRRSGSLSRHAPEACLENALLFADGVRDSREAAHWDGNDQWGLWYLEPARFARLMLQGPEYQESFAEQAALLRDVFGDPPGQICPVQRSRDALALARVIYDERRFEELPVLADALEDAGCDCAQMLAHLRSPGPHVLGCWALDCVLGKE